jgi:hypothetical protein
LSRTEIYNNVFYDNLVGLSASYSDMTLYNNIFYLEKTGDMALKVKGDTLVSDYNIFYPEQNDFLSVSDVFYSTLKEYHDNSGYDLNSFNKDPKFIDVYSDNFEVDASSPAIDAGKSVNLLADFYGNKVPYGSTTDIGLFESRTGSLEPTSLFNNSTEPDNVKNLLIYPNPSNGKFDVNLKGRDQGVSRISITDVVGKIIYEQTYSPDDSEFLEHIELSNLISGIYFVFLKMEDKLYKQSIVIN